MARARHNYEYDVDPSSDTAPANVVRLVGHGKRVLELGCGPGSITRLLTELNQCRVIGMERDPDAIEKVRPHCDSVLQADLNSSDWVSLLQGAADFDVVVAADVLEHLYDPWTTLQQMGALIADDGYLVVSLPHVGHAAITACLMQGDFAYQDWGLLDRTHIRFFCLKNIEQLFARAGLKIIEASYVTKPPQETEFAAIWASLPRTVQAALRSSPHSDVYQVVLKAVPVAAVGDPVRLALLPSDPRPAVRTCWKSRIGSHLSPQTKRRIRRAMSIFGIKADPRVKV